MKVNSIPKIYLYRRLVQAKLFIDQHYAQNLNLNTIADEANISKYYFIRLFKKTYGKTPHQYLTQVRIEQAKKLLRTESSITHICYSLGFDSLSSFTGLFKRLVNKTPSEYRHEQHCLKVEMQNTPLQFIPHCFAEQKGWLEKSNFEEVSR